MSKQWTFLKVMFTVLLILLFINVIILCVKGVSFGDETIKLEQEINALQN